MDHLVPSEAIRIVPRECNTPRLVREFLGLEAIVAANPDHEVFVLLWTREREDSFAVAFRVRKDVVHIQGLGLPIIVDPESRLAVIRIGKAPA